MRFGGSDSNPGTSPGWESDDADAVDDVELFGVTSPAAGRAPGQLDSGTEQVSTVRTGRGNDDPGRDGQRRWLGPLAALLALGAIAVLVTRGGPTSDEASDADESSTSQLLEDGEETSDDREQTEDDTNDDSADDNDALDESDVSSSSVGVGRVDDFDQPNNGPNDAEVSVEIVDAVGEWRPFALPPNTEIVLLESDVLIAQSLSAQSATDSRQLWSSPAGRQWTAFGFTPDGVDEVFAAGPLLWGTQGASGLVVSADAGQTWVAIPDDGQGESSEILARNRSIAIASRDSVNGAVTFRTRASWFFDVLAYEADLPVGSEQCTARTSNGIAIHDNDDCSGEPVQLITFDDLDITPRERAVLRNPQRFAVASFWQVDSAGRLTSLRSLDESIRGEQIVSLSAADGVVIAREATGIEHRLALDNVTLERTEEGLDGPIGQVGETQFGILNQSDSPTVIARSTVSRRVGGLGRWVDTDIRAEFVSAAPGVIAAGHNPGVGASPPIVLTDARASNQWGETDTGVLLVVYAPSPSGDRFELIQSDATVLRSSAPLEVDFLERVDDETWQVVNGGQVIAEFTDDQWFAAAGTAGYDGYAGLAASSEGPSFLHVSTDGETWIRTSIAEVDSRPAFIEHLLVTETAVVVGLSDASVDLDQLLSNPVPRQDRVEWFILDLP